MIRSTILAAAALGAAVIATPAAASTSQSVGYADLDLTTAEGQADLQKRVNRAAWKVCQFNAAGALHSPEAQARCYRDTRQDVAVRLAEAVSDRQYGG